jgi:hypothetical protein
MRYLCETHQETKTKPKSNKIQDVVKAIGVRAVDAVAGIPRLSVGDDYSDDQQDGSGDDNPVVVSVTVVVTVCVRIL